MNCIAHPDEKDWHSLPDDKTDYCLQDEDLKRKIKIGYSKFWGMEKYFDTNLIEKEVVNKIDETVYFLSENGLHIENTELIDWPNNPHKIFIAMWQAGAANLARKINENDFSNMDLSLINFIEKGKGYSIYDLMDADAKRVENATHMKRVFSKFDILIGPTLPVLPFNTE